MDSLLFAIVISSKFLCRKNIIQAFNRKLDFHLIWDYSEISLENMLIEHAVCLEKPVELVWCCYREYNPTQGGFTPLHPGTRRDQARLSCYHLVFVKLQMNYCLSISVAPLFSTTRNTPPPPPSQHTFCCTIYAKLFRIIHIKALARKIIALTKTKLER